MDVFSIPVIAIIGAFSYAIYELRVKAKMAELKAKTKQDIEGSDKQEIEKELAKLKERVIALEAIVTDQDYQLKQDFSQLRKG